MKIGEKIITENDLYFWIEEGQASMGDFETAIKFIDTASEIGADGIEFQLAIPDEFYIATHPAIKHYSKIKFTNNQIAELIQYTKKNKINFIAAVLSKSLIPFLKENGCDAFVINASDINNPEIIDGVIESGLPFFISLPLASESEIDWIVERCMSKKASNYVLMHGQHTMASGEHGVMPEHSNLGFLSTMKNKYNIPVGFIDHSPNSYMPSVARAAGANFISKHLFLADNCTGPDWFVCQNPEKMKATIDLTRSVSMGLVSKEKVLAPGENMDKTVMRRSIVATCDIPAGTVITMDLLAFKRPGKGLPPNEYEKLLGMKSIEIIKKDENIYLNNLE
ncbi:MAG: hypothetical protein A2275_07305 [Bacteroidetes bacterium RIFOXYA12_FULL_35_11]|nr:MAG: hypothetical protein A2X01_06395 [Bacteroidetes bacterium GWF2_35_48]OFY73056.1 MAG: hypothetical protein A2275_07305 [Bacteroidetes bacterium RIFOXYA12_FULL_35_11]OFY93944.1 MAG: hypothetical protein A2491_11880 [Bacteroidetes bacterium RIFOXYC12_FULL_35_7]OFY97843.1 MAG: hypothetical protein A2309_01530 [Bacteroidetes bacterium RIFOXYB2_FULL_35_7]HBX53547.1 hypothetical protein [Bacteroidales bacterium]